jgi:hypothetical protein
MVNIEHYALLCHIYDFRIAEAGKDEFLGSSSALSYNVFGPRRDLDLQPLGAALHAAVQSRKLRFEQKFRHGLRSTPLSLVRVRGHLPKGGYDVPHPVIDSKARCDGKNHHVPLLVAEVLATTLKGIGALRAGLGLTTVRG